MKTAITLALILLSSPSARADKESEKGRLDDCYTDLTEIGNEMNTANMHGDSDAWKINKKFSDKKARCNGLQKDYEKKYGKYAMPHQGPTAKEKSTALLKQDREHLDILKHQLCGSRKFLARCKFEEGVAYYNRECPIDKKNLSDGLIRYKKATGKTFDGDKECTDIIATTKEESAAFDEIWGVGSDSSGNPDKDQILDAFCSPQYNPNSYSIPDKRQEAIIGLHSLCKKIIKEDCKCEKAANTESDT